MGAGNEMGLYGFIGVVSSEENEDEVSIGGCFLDGGRVTESCLLWRKGGEIWIPPKKMV